MRFGVLKGETPKLREAFDLCFSFLDVQSVNPRRDISVGVPWIVNSSN